MLFPGFSHIASFLRTLKNDTTSLQEPFEQRFPPRSRYKFVLGLARLDLGGIWGHVGRLLDATWPAFGRSWAALGPSWALLGRILDASWALLGASEALLGICWLVCGASWMPFWRPGSAGPRIWEVSGPALLGYGGLQRHALNAFSCAAHLVT